MGCTVVLNPLHLAFPSRSDYALSFPILQSQFARLVTVTFAVPAPPDQLPREQLAFTEVERPFPEDSEDFDAGTFYG